VPEDESDDDYQVIAKKPKTAIEVAEPVTESVPALDQRDINITQDKPAQPGDDMEGVAQEVVAENGPVSDADWLRSRTNRVLDFVEDDEQPSRDVPSQNLPVTRLTSPKATEQIALQEVVEPPTEAEQPSNQDLDVPNSSEVEKIRETGRLYLRNLHFEVMEDEIREHFSNYGSLEEVSSNCFFQSYACNDEYQDRDN
jgi:multiple RNA-binding domain-containing protein 1